MPTNVFFVVRVLEAEGEVIQCLHVVFDGGHITGVPLVFAKQLVVDESHGNRFLEFRGGLLLPPPHTKNFLRRKTFIRIQLTMEIKILSLVFLVMQTFSRDPTPLLDCLR
jgi:hypothetical protein